MEMPRLIFTPTKEMLMVMKEIQAKKNISTWSKACMVLIGYGMEYYKNEHIAEQNHLIEECLKKMKDVEDMMMLLFGKVEKVLKTIEIKDKK